MQWYYSEAGMQRGPVSQEELLAMVSSGTLGRHELVWREGMTQWQPLAEVGELRAASPVRSGAPPLPTAPPLPASTSFPAAPPFSTTAGYGRTPPPPGTPISSYLWQSIVLTLLCCMPFGIVAIVFASKVDSLVAQGNFPAAMDASKKAKTWCWAALAAGLLVQLGSVAYIMTAAATAAATTAGQAP